MVSLKMVTSLLAATVAVQAVDTVVNDPAPAAANRSTSKRGLAYIPKNHPEDDKLWITKCSPINWYYNWGTWPVGTYKNVLEFVPMLHGSGDAAGFQDRIKAIKAQGIAVKSVLFVNEPDGTGGGGVNMSPQQAATAYKNNYQALKAQGIRLGGPVTTGSPRGLTWMSDFLKACNGCQIDFMPIHWYGDMNGLKWYLGAVKKQFPGYKLWVTEFANSAATTSQTASDFTKQAIAMFDADPTIERYSYFPAVRYGESNMPQVTTMLTAQGALSTVGMPFCTAPGLTRRFSKRITG